MRLNNFQLKIIGLILMTIAHINYYYYINDWLWIGQASFLIFAFLITQGYIHTRNFNKYVFRMLIFATVIQIPILIVGIDYFNIMFTFAFGLIILKELDTKCIRLTPIILILFYFVNFDYGYYGLLVILLFYFIKKPTYQYIALIALNLIFINYLKILDYHIMYNLLAIPFLALYNGELGYRKLKYLFYIYYPLHIVIILAVIELIKTS